MKNKPRVVCLCGSTRFSEAYQQANLRETLAGRIVLTIGVDMKSDSELFKDTPSDELEQIKQRLDELHKRKIDLADEILVLNVDGYIGTSTKSEIEYARAYYKTIRYLHPEGAPHYEKWVGSDYQERRGNYRREVWETSKAHDFGYCKWNVQYLCADYWWTVTQSNGYMTIDKAMAESDYWLTDAIKTNKGPETIGEEDEI